MVLDELGDRGAQDPLEVVHRLFVFLCPAFRGAAMSAPRKTSVRRPRRQAVQVKFTGNPTV